MPEHDLGITHQDPRLVLIGALKRQGYNGLIAVSAQHEDQVERLLAQGAHSVFLPFLDAAEIAVNSMRASMASAGSAS
jgi:2-keto-3-deoxy-L-rhamnonate aldolase RhmA